MIEKKVAGKRTAGAGAPLILLDLLPGLKPRPTAKAGRAGHPADLIPG